MTRMSADVVRLLAARVERCVSLWLRDHIYGEHCPVYYPPWRRSVLARANHSWFQTKLKSSNFQFRKLGRHHECPSTMGYVGWHFGYAMNSSKLVNKLRSFAHTHDPFVRLILNLSDPEAELTRRAKSCTDVHNFSGHYALAPFDGVLPMLPGWPRHPASWQAADFIGSPDAVNGELAVSERLLAAAKDNLRKALRNASSISIAFRPQHYVWDAVGPGMTESLRETEKTAHQWAFQIHANEQKVHRLRELICAHGLGTLPVREEACRVLKCCQRPPAVQEVRGARELLQDQPCTCQAQPNGGGRSGRGHRATQERGGF